MHHYLQLTFHGIIVKNLQKQINKQTPNHLFLQSSKDDLSSYNLVTNQSMKTHPVYLPVKFISNHHCLKEGCFKIAVCEKRSKTRSLN